MSTWTKFAGRKLACRSCETKLRLHSTSTLLLALAALTASLLTIKMVGFNSTSVVVVFGYLVFLGLCGLAIPFEIRDVD